MRRVQTTVTLLCCVLYGESASAQDVSSQQSGMVRVGAATADSLRARVDTVPWRRIRARRALRGATVGAVVTGITGGLLAYHFIGVGCSTSNTQPCHVQRTRVLFGLSYGALGAVLGSVTGAVVGWALPVQHSDTGAPPAGQW